MTSVSQPFIADLAPSRSSNRPDVPAREARREDEKFALPDAPQSANERKDIPDAPVAPVSPVHPRNDRPPETPDASLSDSTTVPDVGKTDPVQSVDVARAPVAPSEPSSGLIAGIAGTVAGNNATGQTTTTTPAPQGTGVQNATTAATAGQANSAQINPSAVDAQAVNTAATAGQATEPVVPAAAAPTAPGAAGTQLPQAAPQIAAVANVGRAATNGTTPANLAPSSPKTAVGKNTILDQQSGEVEAGGNDVKKPVTAFATGASTAPGVADTAAKPSVPQANSQIMAQAMANTPAIPAATAELTPPSLTAPAPVTGDTLGVTQSFNAEMRAAINAPTQAAAYTARGAVTAQPAVEQIAMQITRAADQNIDRMTVHLKPAELGKVTIDLEVGPDNRLLAVISAERSETLDLLQRDSKSLEKALNDAGIKTDSGSLEFNLKGEGGTAENGRDGDGKLHDGAVMLPGDIDATDVNSIPNNTPLILPEGRIDIQV
ncbi:MAG: flagellar hook-length control protein FliK [Paracoccaceae bacterium]|jgi:flagellar hook-length control protein FliK